MIALLTVKIIPPYCKNYPSLLFLRFGGDNFSVPYDCYVDEGSGGLSEGRVRAEIKHKSMVFTTIYFFCVGV